MIYPHKIRLRKPWGHEKIDGGLRFLRGFNCPSGLDVREQVWLVIEEVPGRGHVYLNGRSLGQLRQGTCAEFDITAHLPPHNELRIDFDDETDREAPATPGSVRLEIRLGPLIPVPAK